MRYTTVESLLEPAYVDVKIFMYLYVLTYCFHGIYICISR